MTRFLPRPVRRIVRRAVATAFLALAAIGASAQQADQVVPPAAVAGNMAKVDEAFAHFAVSSGLAEIEGARLVLKTTRRADVRDYAQRLVKDHGTAVAALRRIVGPRGLKLSATPTGRHADLVTKLGGVEADARDEAFLLRFGVDAHKEAITLYERHATEGVEPELKRHATETLPHLREHLAAAMKLMNAGK